MLPNSEAAGSFFSSHLLRFCNYHGGGSRLGCRLEVCVGIAHSFTGVERNYGRIYYRFLFGFVDELLRLRRVICSRGTVFCTLKALSYLGLGFRPRYAY